MALDLGIFLEGSQSTFKVKVSDNDSQAQYLLDKLTSSDGSVTITETNDGSVETIDLTASSSNPLTTKGDLYTYSTTDERLGVGTDGQTLIADSAEATGLKWGTISADNMATANLTLDYNRTHSLNGYDLSLSNTTRDVFKVTDAGSVEVLNSTTNRGLFIQAGGVPSNILKLYAVSNAEYINSNNTLRILAQNTHTAMFAAKRMSLNSTTLPIPSTLYIKGLGSTSATSTLLIENSSGTDALEVRDDSIIIMANLPTASAGLPTGALWNNSGVLTVA